MALAHLDLRFPASRTVSQQTCVVLRHPGCGALLGSPGKRTRLELGGLPGSWRGLLCLLRSSSQDPSAETHEEAVRLPATNPASAIRLELVCSVNAVSLAVLCT